MENTNLHLKKFLLVCSTFTALLSQAGLMESAVDMRLYYSASSRLGQPVAALQKQGACSIQRLFRRPSEKDPISIVYLSTAPALRRIVR
jgi:hypothetical protein